MDTTHSAAPRQPKILRYALAIGIVILLNVFFSVLVSIALPVPDYSASDAATCDGSGGVWTEQGAPAPATITNEPNMPVPSVASGYCDFTTLENHRALYAFAFMTMLGLLALIAGLSPINSFAISAGLSYGGVVALIIGGVSYWGDANNWLRLTIAAIGLLALLYIAWKRFKD